MKNIKEYLINEAVNINDNILKSIENILSKHLVGKSFTFDLKELFDTENSNQNNITAYGFETTDDLIADCAGYLIEVFVWTKLKNELFNDPDFQNEWLNDVEINYMEHCNQKKNLNQLLEDHKRDNIGILNYLV